MDGFKSRRQHPVAGCIVDFYCREAMLAIELDGGQHDFEEAAADDRERDRALEGGFPISDFRFQSAIRNRQSAIQ